MEIQQAVAVARARKDPETVALLAGVVEELDPSFAACRESEALCVICRNCRAVIAATSAISGKCDVPGRLACGRGTLTAHDSLNSSPGHHPLPVSLRPKCAPVAGVASL
jgi:hypothetical protein